MEMPQSAETSKQDGGFSYRAQRDKWMSGEKGTPTSQGDTNPPLSYQKQRDKWMSDDSTSRPQQHPERQSKL